MPQKGPRGVELLEGETITLAASAARTASGNGTAVGVQGERVVYAFLLNITALATEAGDHLDVYVDTSFDNSTWINIAHFTQYDGNGSAATEIAVVSPSGSGTSTTVVTSDISAEATVRPGIIGAYFRARWTVTAAATTGNESFTFSVTAYAI